MAFSPSSISCSRASSGELEALEHEIEDGLNAMPSYADTLSEEEIIAVATYVEQRAELGWSRR